MPARSLALLTLVALLVTGACSQPKPASPSSNGPARRVILITCDTLRADRLGLYGYPRGTSPELDAFAAEAVVFEEAYACAAMTVPSLSSLMTGLLPQQIGIYGNGALIAPEIETLAESVSAAGIPTGAFISNWVLRSPSHPSNKGAGIDQGFDLYDDEMPERELNRHIGERLAPDTTDAALGWLEELAADGDDCFFLWVHYQDPHGPYTPPPEIAQAFRSPPTEERALPLGTTHRGYRQLPEYQILDGERRPQPYRDLYDAEIRYFDRELGRLLDWLEEHDLVDDSLVLFTSDHGESLGEKDYWFCHGENVNREVVRVPFFVRYPQGHEPLPRVKRVETAVSHLDVRPTVLAAFGLPIGEALGQSLLEPLAGERVLVQTSGMPRRRGETFVGVTDGSLRVVKRGREPWRLFDLGADPAESVDLAPANAEKRDELVQRYRKMMRGLKDAPTYRPVRRQLTPEDKKAFHDLGYTGDEDEPDEEPDDEALQDDEASQGE